MTKCRIRIFYFSNLRNSWILFGLNYPCKDLIAPQSVRLNNSDRQPTLRLHVNFLVFFLGKVFLIIILIALQSGHDLMASQSVRLNNSQQTTNPSFYVLLWKTLMIIILLRHQDITSVDTIFNVSNMTQRGL